MPDTRIAGIAGVVVDFLESLDPDDPEPSTPPSSAATSHSPARTSRVTFWLSDFLVRVNTRTSLESLNWLTFSTNHVLTLDNTPVSSASARTAYIAALASAITSTPPAENTPDASCPASSPAKRFVQRLDQVTPACAFSKIATAQPHMYTPLAGIRNVDNSHTVDPSGIALTTATPGVQVKM